MSTLKYIYDGFGNKHQVEQDFMLPSYLSLEPKPTLKEDQVAVIIESQWIVNYDYRRRTIWLKTDSGVSHLITELGDIDPDYTLVEPNNAYSIFNKTTNEWQINETLRVAHLLIEQERKWTEAKQLRDTRIDAVDLITLKNGHTYQIDGVTRVKLVEALAMANALGFTDGELIYDDFINSKNMETDLYKADLVTLITEKLAIEKKIRTFYTELRNEINKTTTHDALAAVKINY